MRELITIVEEKSRDQLELNKLPYDRDSLEPVLSKQAIDYHYGKLAKGYVDRYNAGEGDDEFNQAGAYLHNIFFTQLQPPSAANKPQGAVSALINQHYGSYEKFQEELKSQAMSIQGSGWVYLAKNGSIKTIKNHQIKSDILLLIDFWEHAFALDYQHDKQKYLKNFWKIINWDAVNQRL